MDICLFSASCVFHSIQFEVTVEAEKDTELWVIPSNIDKNIMEESAPVANFTNELICLFFYIAACSKMCLYHRKNDNFYRKYLTLYHKLYYLQAYGAQIHIFL